MTFLRNTWYVAAWDHEDRAGCSGTCITRVLDGMPDHRDMYFTDEEEARNDQFTPCCSRATSRVLVLEL